MLLLNWNITTKYIEHYYYKSNHLFNPQKYYAGLFILLFCISHFQNHTIKQMPLRQKKESGQQPNVMLPESLSKNTTVFYEAEVEKIAICSDSKAAVKAIDSAQINSKLV